MEKISRIFNIDEYYKNNAGPDGWQREQFIEAVQKLEAMSLDDLRVFVKKVGNPSDAGFFEVASDEQLVLYLLDDVDKNKLIQELGV